MKFSALNIASLIVAVALVVYLVPLPELYFLIVKIATAIVAGCWIYRFLNLKMVAPAILAVGVLVVYQPIFTVDMGPSAWGWINILVALMFVVSALYLNKK